MSITVTLPTTADALVDQSTPRANYGGLGWLTAGYGATVSSYSFGLTRIFIKFDLSSIPAGSTVSDAYIYINAFYESDAYTIPEYDMAQVPDLTWTESKITWNNQPTSWSARWSAIDAFGVLPNVYEFVGLQSPVRAALSVGQIGFVIYAYDETLSNASITFSSKEWDQSLGPNLTVTYTPPTVPKSNMFLMF